jgi:AdoMet-dependent heme synthase
VNLRDSDNLHGKCGRCEYRDLCGGSRARAWAMTGDVFGADPLCAYQPA